MNGSDILSIQNRKSSTYKKLHIAALKYNDQKINTSKHNPICMEMPV